MKIFKLVSYQLFGKENSEYNETFLKQNVKKKFSEFNEHEKYLITIKAKNREDFLSITIDSTLKGNPYDSCIAVQIF